MVISCQETSGLVFSIITVIARISSGALIIAIQEFYPEERLVYQIFIEIYPRRKKKHGI